MKKKTFTITILGSGSAFSTKSCSVEGRNENVDKIISKISKTFFIPEEEIRKSFLHKLLLNKFGRSYNSNFLFETSNSKKNLLFDCGSDIRFTLDNVGKSLKDITDVYISHLHADHIGGIEGICLYNYFLGEKPNLFISEDMIKEFWRSIRSGLETLEKRVRLETYFEKINKIGKEKSFTWNGIKFKLIKVIHYYNGDVLNPTYGLFFKLGKKKIFFTSDTKCTTDYLMKYWKEADLIFQDCETSPLIFRSKIHAHYDELRSLPKEIKKKMYIYHYNDGDKEECKKQGFKGWLYPGQKIRISF